MEVASQTRIYLASKRGCTETQIHRSFHTFNFGTYYDKSRVPFGALKGWNDEVLAARKAVTHQVYEATVVLVVPVHGCAKVNNDLEPTRVGEVRVLSVKNNDVITITNPETDQLSNFLTIWVSSAKEVDEVIFLKIGQNNLTSVSPPSWPLYAGSFIGRTDYRFISSIECAGIFAFVLEGAFEINHCLLQARDGLAIPFAHDVCFEALSNNALLFLLQV